MDEEKLAELIGILGLPQDASEELSWLVDQSKIDPKYCHDIDKMYGTNTGDIAKKIIPEIANFLIYAKESPENEKASNAFDRYLSGLREYNEEIQKLPNEFAKEVLLKDISNFFIIAKLYVGNQNSINNKNYPTTLEELFDI